MREYLLCLFAAAAVTYLATAPVRRLAIGIGAVAEVRDRDVHAEPTPRLGGLAMFLGLLAGMLLSSKLPMMREMFPHTREWFGLLAGCTLIVALGVVDDRFGLDAPTKFAGQVLAAAVMAFEGVQVLYLPTGSGSVVLDPTTSIVLTVLVVVVTVNAINFVDGLDGLAAGIVAIAALAFFAYSYLLSVEYGFQRATMPTLISACLAGICLGFLPHNLYPARIFMGDTGAMLIGLLLAASTITMSGQVDTGALEGTTLLPALLPILLPVAVVAIPLIDLLLAVVRRTRARRSPFAADKEHLHHRLLELGHSQRRAVLLLHLWTLLIAGAAVALAFVPVAVAALGFFAGVVVLVLAVRWPTLQTRFRV